MKNIQLNRSRSLLFVVATLSISSFDAYAAIVINEVMYRPLNQGTAGSYEFVEFYNTSDSPADMSGFIFTDSQDVDSMCSIEMDRPSMFLDRSGI